MASFRHLSRVIVMQSLFAQEAREQDSKLVFEYILKEFGPKIQDDSFAKELFFGILETIDEIQDAIVRFAPEWPIDKIDPVERAILYIGVYELLKCPDTPKAVVINEAIEIAKEYADQNSGKFVNGVLNSVAQEVGAKDEKKPKKTSKNPTETGAKKSVKKDTDEDKKPKK